MADRNYILEIILRARDETSAAIASAITKLKAYEEAQKKLDEQQRKSAKDAAEASQSQRSSADRASRSYKELNPQVKGLTITTLESAQAQKNLQSALERSVEIQAQGKKGTVEHSVALGEAERAEKRLSESLHENEKISKTRADAMAHEVALISERKARENEELRVLESLRAEAAKLAQEKGLTELNMGDPRKIAATRAEIEKLRGSLRALYGDARGGPDINAAMKRFETTHRQATEEEARYVRIRQDEIRKSAQAIYETFSETTQRRFEEAGVPQGNLPAARILQRSITPAYQVANPAADQSRETRATGDLRRAREQLIQAGLSEEQAEKALHAVREQALRDYGFESAAAREASRSRAEEAAQTAEVEKVLRSVRQPANVLASDRSNQTQLIQAQQRIAEARQKLIEITNDQSIAEQHLQSEIDRSVSATRHSSLAAVEEARVERSLNTVIEEQEKQYIKLAQQAARVRADPRSTANEDTEAERRLLDVRNELIRINGDATRTDRILNDVRQNSLRTRGFLTQSERDATQVLRAQRNETEAVTEAMRRAEVPAHTLANISSTQPQELAAKRQLASITENLSRSLNDEVRARRIVNSVQLEALNRHGHESQEARDLVQANHSQVRAYEEVERAQRKVISTSRQYENATRSFRSGRTRHAPVVPAVDDETLRRASTDIGQGGVTMGQAGASADGLAAKLQGLSRTVANLDTSTQGFDQSLRNAFGFSAVALIQPLITLLVGLAGTFAAVGSAAIAAGGALVTTFVAGIAQGIPAVGLFAAAMQRLQTIFGYVTAQQQQQQQHFISQYQTARLNAMGINQVAIAQHDYSNALYSQQQAIRQVGVSEHDYQNAIYSRQQAVRGITVAEHSYSDAIYSTRLAEINVKNAEFALLQTRQQATRQLQDLIIQEQSAKLAAEASSLAVTDAQKALANAVATGGDVRAAQLQLQQAQLGHTQAVNQAQRAIADATPGSITRQGITQQVQQAQQGVESSRRAVVDAQFAQAQAQQGVVQARHAVVDANYALVSARQGIIQAQRAVIDSQFQVAQARAAIILAQQAATGYNLATAAQLAWLRSQMTQTELSLANNITRIYDLFRGVHGYLRPITDAILAPFVTLSNKIYSTLRDPRMFNALHYLGSQMGAALNQLFSAAFRPDVLNNFRIIIRQAAENLRPLASIAVDMFRGIQAIVVQAGPYVHGFLLFIGRIASQFDTWARSVRGKTWLKDFFNVAFPSLQAFINAGIAILRLIAAVVVTGNGAKTGIGVVRDFTRWLDGLTNSINSHGRVWRDLQRLWSTVHPALSALKEVLGALLQGLLQIGGSKSGRDNLKAVADLLAHYLIPAFIQFVQITGKVIGVIVQFLDKHPAVASMLRDLIGFALAWTILRRGLGLLFGPLAGILDIAGRVVEGFKAIKNFNWAGSTIGRFGRAAKDALAPILSPIATAIRHPIQTVRSAGRAVVSRLPGRGGLGAARVAQVGEYGAGAAETGAEGAGAATAATGAATGGGGIAGTLGAVAAPAAAVAAAILGIAAATGNLSRLWNAVKAPFVSFWNEIRRPLHDLSKDFSYFIDSFSRAKGPVGTSLHVIGAVFGWLWRLIKNGVGSVFDSFKDILGAIGHVLGKLAGDALKILGDVFRLLGDIIRGRWGRVWKDIKKLFGDFLGWFWDALKSIPQLVLSILKSMWNRTWEFFGTTGRKVWNWAKGVGQSIVNGIGGFVSGLWRHLVKWFWDAVHAVERFLGISSPSKTFWNIGWNMIMGLLHGLESVGSGILNFGKKIVDWIVNGIKSAPGKLKNAIVGLIPKGVRGVLSHVPLVGGLFKAEGGPIDPGGYGGGDRHVTVLESGEHVLTKEEVRSAGGHEGVYDYRRSLGGGGQSRGQGMQRGGAATAAQITNADFLTAPQASRTSRTTNTEGVTGALGGALQNILNFRKRFTADWQNMWTQIWAITRNNSRSTQTQFQKLEDGIVSIWDNLLGKSVSFWKRMQNQSSYYSGQILSQITKSWDQINTNVNNRLQSFLNEYKGAYTRIATDTFNAMWYIQASANSALKAFQGQTVHVTLGAIPHFAMGGMVERTGNIARTILPIAREKSSNITRTLMPIGRATQFVGQMGERGHDMVHAVLGRGEAVLNHVHQQYVNPAINHMYGWKNGLHDLYRNVRGEHGVGPAAENNPFIAKAQRMASGGYAGYSLPLPRQFMGGSWSPDEGVDINGGTTHIAGAPLYAIGPGKIIREGLSGFGPNAPVLLITSGPLAGNAIYYGHAGPDTVRVGSVVRAGQQISSVGKGIVGISTGPHLEIGFASPRSGSPIGATSAPAMVRLLHQLLAGSGVQGINVPGGGGGGGGVTWNNIQNLAVRGTGILANILRGAVRKATDAANNYGQQQAGQAGGVGGAFVGGGAGYAQAVRWTQQAMRIAGVSGSLWRNVLLRQEQRESSYNPNAINRTDINAQRGDPSRGILQVIGSTFRRFAMRGYDKNIFDPVSNIIAAIRYMIATYGGGNANRAAQVMSARGGGAYAEGGVIGERERHPLGRALGIVAHAGEWIVNKTQQSKLAKKFNTSVSAIRETLFSTREEKAHKTHYQVGGQIGGYTGPTMAGWTSTTGAFRPPDAVDLNIPGWTARALWQYNWTQRQITTRIERNGANLSRGIQQFLANYALVGGDNGLFAQAATAIDNFTNNLNNQIAFLASGVREIRSGMLRFGRPDTAVQQAFRQQWATIHEGDWLHELQIQEVNALRAVNQQLSRLGRPTRSNMAIWQQLMGARQDLTNKIQDTDQKLAQNLQDQYQNAVNLFQAQLAQNLRGTNTLTGQAIRAVTGQFALGTGEGIINGFRNLRDVLAKVGPNIALGIAQMAQSVAQAAGDITQTLMADRGVLQAARAQQRALQNAYDRAAARARTDPRWQSVADDLLGQLESATEQVVQAQQQAFQDRMTAIQQQIQAAPQAQSGFLQAAQGITQTLGQIAGTQNLPTLIQYAHQNATALASQGQDIIAGVRQALSGSGANAMFGANQGQAQNLLGQLVQAFQQGPQDFANVLSSMGPQLANFEAHLPANQQTLFQNLVQALIDNTTATVNNSQNLQQLQATTNQQDFASSAWSQLREAIFNGMGQLLPQYAMTVPSADVGGIITKEGLLHGHRGETITPAEIVRPFAGHAPIHKHIESHTHITNPTEVADPVYLANRIAFNIGQMPNER